jgi:glutaredoxin
LKILRPKKFEIWGKDVGMVWKLFVEGALCYNVAVGLRINDACDMNKTKKLATAAILLAAASAFLIVELPKIKTAETNNGNPAAQMILYYGNSCPHCKTVENYIAENNLAEKLRIEQKEISSDRTNQDEFIRTAKSCGLGSDNLGVPMLWDAKTQKCHSGDQTIIDFLRQADTKPPL